MNKFEKMVWKPKKLPNLRILRNKNYLFENCGLRLAFLRPHFLRSTTRLSLVRRPCGLSAALKSASIAAKALEIPCLKASA